jgi:hypothetical protein
MTDLSEHIGCAMGRRPERRHDGPISLPRHISRHTLQSLNPYPILTCAGKIVHSATPTTRLGGWGTRQCFGRRGVSGVWHQSVSDTEEPFPNWHCAKAAEQQTSNRPGFSTKATKTKVQIVLMGVWQGVAIDSLKQVWAIFSLPQIPFLFSNQSGSTSLNILWLLYYIQCTVFYILC